MYERRRRALAPGWHGQAWPTGWVDLIEMIGRVRETGDVPPFGQLVPLHADRLAAREADCLGGVVERAGVVGQLAVADPERLSARQS